MESIETANLNIQYRQAGTGEIPLVFLHGNYASSRWWIPQLEIIPQNTRAYAPDFRGCGSQNAITKLKKQPGAPLSISDLAKDLHEFLTALNIQRPVLIGHSLGGVVATEFALRYADSVRCLVLEDTGPADNLPLLPFPGILFFPLELGSKAIIKRALRIAGLAKGGSYTKALLDDAVAAKPGQYLAFTQALLKWNIKNELHNLSLPVLLIWGQRDLIMPSRINKQYQKELPKSELSIISNSGHTPHLESPEEFANLLSGFLEKHCS